MRKEAATGAVRPGQNCEKARAFSLCGFPAAVGVVVCAALAVAVVSCAAVPEPAKQPVELPGTFSKTGTGPLPEKWWTALDDAELEALVNRALQENFSLKTARDRLRQARAVARREGAALLPQANASASASRTASEGMGPGAGGSSGGRSYEDEFSLGLSASYEVDLWGRVDAARDAAVLAAGAGREDLRAAALSLSANVALTWYRIVEQRSQLELLAGQVATNERYLDLVELRFRKGEVSATDVLQQRKLVESTRTERASARAALEVLEHQLGVLLGAVPARAQLPGGGELPELPVLPETGVPAEWMRQRPDVGAAYLRVRSADREAAAAVADRLASFSISASLRSAADEPSGLLEDWLAAVAGELAAPLFDGGRREAEADRARAAAEESLHIYAQTVLTGVREVEDALSNEAQDRTTLAGTRRQLELSDATLEQLLRMYRNGTVDFLRVLDELRTNQQLQRSLLSARARLVRDRVELYRALGGGWEQEPGAGPEASGRRAPAPEDSPERPGDDPAAGEENSGLSTPEGREG